MTHEAKMARVDQPIKLYAVNAWYRPEDRGRNWYYVRARNKTEARKRFGAIVTWLDIYEVTETEPQLAEEIMQNRQRYIVF